MKLELTNQLQTIIRGIRFIVFDFDGVFTNNMVYLNEYGEEMVRCSRGDGMGIDLLKELPIQLAVITKEKNPVASFRCKKLKLKCLQGIQDKAPEMERLLKSHGCDFDSAAYVGNDINDLGCLEKVRFPIIVADAHLSLLEKPFYRTSHKGGKGAIREVADLFCTVFNS